MARQHEREGGTQAGQDEDGHANPELGRALGAAAEGVDAGGVSAIARLLLESARRAGAKAVASGQWLAGLLIETAPRITVRDRATLVADHGGMTGVALAGELVRNASRQSAAVGGAVGALAGVHTLAPPSLLAAPLELVVETLAVAAIELKLVAELHEVYGRPLPGPADQRSVALLRAWAERRGVRLDDLSPGSVVGALGRTARPELVRTVRRRLLSRTARNVTSLAPLFTGAVAGAELNRRATRDLGTAVVQDLSR